MIIRPITPADQPAILALLTNDQIKQTYMLPDYEKIEDAIPLFRRLMDLSNDETRFVRAMDENGEVVGFLNDVEIENGTMELGYVVHPAHWGQGCATAALKLAIRELFAQGYREITAGAFHQNPASLRVMEKAGMTKIDKTDEIEYRGKTHRCIYYSISPLSLVTPSLPDMHFRKALLADEATMSYNHAYGGTIDFAENRWETWYSKWISSQNPQYFYRYLYSPMLNAYVGEAAYHYEPETDRYLCDVIVHSQFRGKGFGKLGLSLLCQAAKKNGIPALYDDILLDNPSVNLFLKNGFQEVGRTDDAYIVKKDLC